MRYSKAMSVLLLASLMMGSAAGCSGPSATRKSEIIVAQGVDAPTLDGHVPGGVPKVNIDYCLHQQLVTRDADNKLAPALATSWKQVDERTWEFKLRQGVRFHNGEELTAETVKASIERIVSPPKGLSTYGYLAGVTGAEVVDKYTVCIKSKDPMPMLPAALVLIQILPLGEIQGRSAQEIAAKPVGAGPFKFVEWQKDDHITMEAFKDFWGGAPRIQKVVFKPIPEDDVRVAALIAGDVDIITNVPLTAIGQLKSSKDVVIYQVPGPRSTYVGFNTEKPGPLTDVRVRQALNYAVDKDAIFNQIMEGYGGPAEGQPVGPIMFGYNPSVKPYPYDLQKAKELLDQAGYPNGFAIDMDCSFGRFPKDKEIAEAIAALLGKAGIQVKLNRMDWATYTKKRVDRQYSGLYLTSLGYGTFDGYSMLVDGLKTKSPFSTYSDPELDKLISDIGKMSDLTQREAALQQAMKMAHDDAVWLFLGPIDTIFAARKNVKGYRNIVENLWLGQAYKEG